MRDYGQQHKDANALYKAYLRALEVYFNQAKEELEVLLRQYLEGVKNTAPIFLKTNTIFPPIPIPFYPLDVSLLGFSEKGTNNKGLFFTPYLSSIYPFKHEGSAYYLLYRQNCNYSPDKVILSADEPLYLKLKKKVIEWATSQDNKFNNDDERIKFFDALVKQNKATLEKEGINYKYVNRSKDEYSPFLSKESAKDSFGCIHRALLNYVIIKEVIEKLPIKGIEVLSLHNFTQIQYNGEYIGGWHQNNLLVDSKSGKIIAIVDADGLYQPTEPITIEQLLEKRQILAKNMYGQYRACYLPNVDGGSFIQLYQGGSYVKESLFRAHFMAKVNSASFELKDFSFQNLEGKDFSNQNLSGALFIGANLRGANLTGADLTGASLKGADLRWATFNQKTILPKNLIKNSPAFPFSEKQIDSLSEAEAAKAQAFNQSIQIHKIPGTGVINAVIKQEIARNGDNIISYAIGTLKGVKELINYNNKAVER